MAYVRYMQQLEDVEVISPVSRINSAQDVNALLNAFETTYSRKYTHAAKYPEVGYQIMEVGLHALVPKLKPQLRKYPLRGRAPSEEALKGERKVYQGGEWKRARIYEMDLLESGNEAKGLAILEAPATTMLVPGDKKVRVDEYKRYWLEEG